MSFASQINARFEVGWRNALITRLRDGDWHRVYDLLEHFGPLIPLEVALRHFDREQRIRNAAAGNQTQRIARGRKQVLLHAITNMGVERRGYRGGRLLTSEAAVRFSLQTCVYCGKQERAPGHYRKTAFYCSASHKNLHSLRRRGIIPLHERRLVCRGCGVTYTQTRYKRSQFHNKVCFNTWNAARERATGNPRVMRTCATEGCTETFVAIVHKTREIKRYHSKQCAMRTVAQLRKGLQKTTP